MNEIKVVFSPELDIELAKFIEIWNNTPEYRQIAQAQLSKSTQTQYVIDPASLVDLVDFIMGAVAGGVLHDSLKKGIKLCLAKIQPKITNLQFKEMRQEDGSIILQAMLKKGDMPPSEQERNL